jgi:endo-1,4-beta-D-glucanase Y
MGGLLRLSSLVWAAPTALLIQGCSDASSTDTMPSSAGDPYGGGGTGGAAAGTGGINPGGTPAATGGTPGSGGQVATTGGGTAVGGSGGQATTGGGTSVGGASGGFGGTTTGGGGATGGGAGSSTGAAGGVGGASGGAGGTATGGTSGTGGSTSGAGGTTTGGQTGTGGTPDDRGPTPPSDTANFPFPQNRESSHCVYPASYTNADVRALYDAWKADLVTSDGAGGFRRVARVDEPGLEPNSTVSEGIAYGMMISVYMDDQALFDDLWQYALQYSWTWQAQFPETGSDPTLLMNWYIHADGNISQGGGDDPAGNGAATDADEDMAFALIMADRQWGGSGSLSRSYLDYALELIDDIWTYEIADERLPKNGSNWGSDTNLNISYFAPAYYRTFAEVSGDNRWLNNVVEYIYVVIDNNLNASNQNENNGLVPAWSTSSGDPAEVGLGQDPQPFHYQYDSCRTPFRIGQDACWHGDGRAIDYVAKTSQFFSGIGAANMVDGYELDGTPRPEFGGLSGAFVGPAAVGAMHDGAFSAFVEEVYSMVRQNNMWVGGQYYDESWHMMSILMMTGNFLDYTQYD